MVVARGTLEDWPTTRHKNRQSSKEWIEFHPGEKHTFWNGNVAPLSPMIKAHAALMFFAWALCAPIG